MPDYTKMRKSKTIRICPKCKRKGKFRHGSMDTYARVNGVKVPHHSEWDDYYHVTESLMGGLGESVREHCTVNYVRTQLETGAK